MPLPLGRAANHFSDARPHILRHQVADPCLAEQTFGPPKFGLARLSKLRRRPGLLLDEPQKPGTRMAGLVSSSAFLRACPARIHSRTCGSLKESAQGKAIWGGGLIRHAPPSVLSSLLPFPGISKQPRQPQGFVARQRRPQLLIH